MTCLPAKFLWTRFVAGLGFLALAGGLAKRQAPGRIALWPAAMVPTWFGISHLVAGVTCYRGCPELGATAVASHPRDQVGDPEPGGHHRGWPQSDPPRCLALCQASGEGEKTEARDEPGPEELRW